MKASLKLRLLETESRMSRGRVSNLGLWIDISKAGFYSKNVAKEHVFVL